MVWGMETWVILHNIRSAHNVGSIFRTADAAGVARILLSGYTPTPLDRFGRPQKEVAKTALGAERTVPWEYFKTVNAALKHARAAGFTIVGVELDDRAIDFRAFRRSGATAFVFGNEVRGLSPALRTACDTLIQIPMRGTKESLNVSVAAGIILFHAAA
jgi:23S rRNA (guanosine2251-2'-O)-methyltransferase